MVIAEVAQNHDGSLGMAHAFIDAVAESGADAIKFQTHIADAESTLDEPFRVRFSTQDKTRLDYWRRMEFTPDQWRELAEHARQKGLIFLSSAFSVEAVQLLSEIGMPAWKVGSGEFQSYDLLEAMVKAGGPVLFSTGMATRQEITKAVAWFRDQKVEHAIFQCTSIYPTPLEKTGLNFLDEFRNEFGCPVGLSDHSGTIYPGMAAMAQGADLLEVHVTFHKGMFGPDVPASITFEELRTLCLARDAFAVMNANPVDKEKQAEELGNLRQIFGKSLAPVKKLEAGTILQPELLTSKKPAGGISPGEIQKLCGRRLIRTITPDRILSWKDIEGDEK